MDGMERQPPLVPGYDVLQPIGAGSSGRVWRARRQADALVVALKVIDLPGGEVADAMHEAAVLASVRHRHLIHLYDVLPVPGPGGRPTAVALAVQLAEGGSLAQVLTERGHLTPGELVTVAAPLAAALADLHRAGVVHGDVSPGNVLFLGDGMPMLSDLGACRIAGEPVAVVHGTDGMAAPELLEGFAPSADSDVYALGALAWVCLTGDPPGWVGMRVPLEEQAPEVPVRMRELVTACLAPEPADRPEADEVAASMFDAATAEPVELAPGADPAAGLTHRLRVEAGVLGASSGDNPAQTRRRALHPWALRRADRDHGGAGPAPGRWRRAVTGGAALLVLGLLVPAAAQLGDRWTAGPGGGQVTSTSAPGHTPSTDLPAVPAAPTAKELPGAPGAGQVGAGALASEPTGPASDTAPVTATPAAVAGSTPPPEQSAAVSVMQPLLDARAGAWMFGDPADLAAAHAPGSPALAQDGADLTEATARGVGYRDLTFSVVDALLESEEEDVMVLTATVRRSDYRLTGAAGDPAGSPPATTEEVRLELRRTPLGWRIWSWS